MSSHGPEDGDTCKFGHIFEVFDRDGTGAPGGDLRDAILEEEITSVEDLENTTDTDLLRPIMGHPFKHLEVAAGSQGLPHMFILDAADRFDDSWGWTVNKTMDRIFVSPQSNLHAEFMQRKQQAEQNIKNTMQNLSQLKKQKHMLEHDIRKLRSRAEAIRQGKEDRIKGDFIELVDGAGASGQGGDEASLKFYRDNNFYPSIVADFNEMSGLEDLEEDGSLSELPANEKAILKKKYTMYEKWKDLYGSEIQRKLNDLKSQLRSIERSIEETEDWLEPYARDLLMIHDHSRDDSDMTNYWTFKGHSSQKKEFEFIAHQGFAKHHGDLEEVGDDEATHFKVVYIHAVHVNIAGAGNPTSSTEGPTVGVAFIFPAIVCRHVFNNIFKDKIERSSHRLQQLIDDYTGDFDTETGSKIRKARNEEDLSVRELREKISEHDDVDQDLPVEFSSAIRRLEDGLDSPDEVEEEYGSDVMDALKDILDVDFSSDSGSTEDQYDGFEKTLREFTGQYDQYHMEDVGGLLKDLNNDLKFKYYFDMKIGLGLNTMK
ncbi:MAG: hypothetical protein ABEJ99_00765 [Candidatus Nanohaloarchaea archaeon]